MAARNMEQLAEKTVNLIQNTKGLIAYSMSLDELERLYRVILDGQPFQALSMAFDFGIAQGVRMANNRNVSI